MLRIPRQLRSDIEAAEMQRVMVSWSQEIYKIQELAHRHASRSSAVVARIDPAYTVNFLLLRQKAP